MKIDPHGCFFLSLVILLLASRIICRLHRNYQSGFYLKDIMMTATIRRKALPLLNNGIAQSIERTQPALAGSASRGYVAGIPMLEEIGRKSKLVPGFHQGPPAYSKSLRDVVSSPKTDFPTQTWSRSFFTYREPAKLEKTVNTLVKRTHTAPAYFTASGAVAGSVLSTPIVKAPQAAKLGLGSTVFSTFLPNLALFWHINNGIEEILADYVHHEMTRSLILVLMRLFLIVAAKDVFVATN